MESMAAAAMHVIVWSFIGALIFREAAASCNRFRPFSPTPQKSVEFSLALAQLSYYA